ERRCPKRALPLTQTRFVSGQRLAYTRARSMTPLPTPPLHSAHAEWTGRTPGGHSVAMAIRRPVYTIDDLGRLPDDGRLRAVLTLDPAEVFAGFDFFFFLLRRPPRSTLFPHTDAR